MEILNKHMESLYPSLFELCTSLEKEFNQISEERKQTLKSIASYINQKQGEPIHLISVCTHNSRRSHFGQVASKLAAAYYRKTNIHTYSAGTEATAVHPNTIETLNAIGCKISVLENNFANPTYEVILGSNISSICFSKVIDHPNLPKKDFAAIMTCTEAEQNCPFLPGADIRIGTPYIDPKAHDKSPEAIINYKSTFELILREWLYAFCDTQ